MGKTRGALAATAVVAAAALTGGCTHLVHQEELEGMFDEVNAQLADHDGRLGSLESDVSALQNDVAELRRRLDQLANDFDAHVSDTDLHCGCGLGLALPVHFDFDRAEIRDVDRPILDAFADAVNSTYPDAHVTVEGFADPAGTAGYNVGLSRRRANNVREYLIGQGMNGDNIRVAALGEARQVIPGAQGPGQSGIENRRVTFVVEWAGLDVAN